MTIGDDGEASAVFTGEFVVPGRTPEDLWLSHLERYRFASELVANKTVLDVACGTGYGSDYLAEHGAKSVVGGDLSPQAIAHAAGHFDRPNLAFFKLSANSLPFRKSTFDAVVSFETLEHLEHPEQFLRECSRVLRPEGSFVCSTPMRFAWRPPWAPKSLNPYHVQEFSLGELQSMIAREFDRVELFGQACSRFTDVLTRYLAFSSGLILSLIPRTRTLSTGARDFVLGLRPHRARKNIDDRSLFRVKRLPRTLPGFPGIVIAKALRRT